MEHLVSPERGGLGADGSARFGVPPADDDVRALARERQRDTTPNTTSRAGDDGHLVS